VKLHDIAPRMLIACALATLVAIAVAESANAKPPSGTPCPTTVKDGSSAPAQNCTDPEETTPPYVPPPPPPDSTFWQTPVLPFFLGTQGACMQRGSYLCAALGAAYGNPWVGLVCKVNYDVMCKSTYPLTAGDPTHVVRRGESLWSIASDVLGDGASVASVAQEVNRLWQLNEDRIGSGRPDVLYAGTRLRLR
jgi:nucleoid-associated protein YgaU